MFCRLRANIPQNMQHKLYFSITFELRQLAAPEPLECVLRATQEPLLNETQEAVSFLFSGPFKRGISPQLTKDELSEILLDN